ADVDDVFRFHHRWAWPAKGKSGRFRVSTPSSDPRQVYILPN
ncbi:MAG: hypothetical protein ACI91T_002199, partial [Natronomonas sp.]